MFNESAASRVSLEPTRIMRRDDGIQRVFILAMASSLDLFLPSENISPFMPPDLCLLNLSSTSFLASSKWQHLVLQTRSSNSVGLARGGRPRISKNKCSLASSLCVISFLDSFLSPDQTLLAIDDKRVKTELVALGDSRNILSLANKAASL